MTHTYVLSNAEWFGAKTSPYHKITTHVVTEAKENDHLVYNRRKSPTKRITQVKSKVAANIATRERILKQTRV